MIEENRAEIQNQLETWDVEISELDDEQRELLKTMIEENRVEVQAHLEAWGVEIPEVNGPHGFSMGFRGRGARGFSLFKP